MLKYVGIIIIVLLIIGVIAFAIKPQPSPVSTPAPSMMPAASSSPSPTDTNADIISQIKAELVAEHGPSASDLVVSVTKTERDYAQGLANDPAGGGGMWFAVNLNGQWKLIWDGNGNIMCDQIKEYPDLPSSMISACYDEAANKLIYR